MAMNSLQKALVNAGLAEEPKDRKRRGKQFKCNKCGEVMEHPDGMNVMFCVMMGLVIKTTLLN